MNNAAHKIRKKVIGEDEARRYRNARITLGTASDQDILDMMNDADVERLAAERKALEKQNVSPCTEGAINSLPPKLREPRKRQ